MIYTVTFNPSLDYVITTEDFALGKTNRAKNEQIFPGGKGINVSIVLKNLGVESTAIGFTAGFTGEEIQRRLKAMGLRTDFLPVREGMSRINVKLKSIEGTELNGIGPRISREETRMLFERLDRLQKGDFLVLAGSVPAGLPDTIYGEICGRMAPKGVELVVDAAGELLKQVLPYRPFLIKPNCQELGELFGAEIQGKAQAASRAGRLVEMGAKNVLVSDQIYPPVSGSFPMGWEVEDDSKTYVALTAEVKNLTETSVSADQICDFHLLSGETTYDSTMTAVLEDGETNLNSGGSIPSGETRTVYFIVEYDKDAVSKETAAEFAFNQQNEDEPVFNYKLTVNTTEPVAVTKELKFDEKITVDGLCELTPKSAKFADKIEPANPGYYYNYYKAQSADDRLLVLTINVTNLSGEEKDAYLFCGMNAVSADKVYVGGVVADDEDRANITQYETIEKNGQRTIYGIANMPKEAENQTCDIYLYAGGEYYRYTLK